MPGLGPRPAAGLVPGQRAPFLPVGLGILDEAFELFGLDAERSEVALELRHRGSAAQRHVHPRLSQYGGQRHGIRGHARAACRLEELRHVTAPGEPAVGERFLDDHSAAGRVGRGQRRSGRALE